MYFPSTGVYGLSGGGAPRPSQSPVTTGENNSSGSGSGGGGSANSAFDALMLTSRLQQTIAALANSGSAAPPIALLSLEANPNSNTGSMATIAPSAAAPPPQPPPAPSNPPSAEHLMAALGILGLGGANSGGTVSSGCVNNTVTVTTTNATSTPTGIVDASELLNQLYSVKQQQQQKREEEGGGESKSTEKESQSSPNVMVASKAQATVLVPPQPQPPTAVTTSTIATSTTFSVRGARNSDGTVEPCLVCGDVASGNLGINACPIVIVWFTFIRRSRCSNLKVLYYCNTCFVSVIAQVKILSLFAICL